MINGKNAIVVCATCLLLAGCEGYNKLLNSNDFDAKYAAAMKYYNENSYSRAIQLFESLTMHYRGKENAENIAWYYAQALLKDGDYFTAGYQFKRFARQFPYSQKVEDAVYLSAYCKYMDSPDYYHDQTSTKEAVAEFESFVERWPRSVRIPEVNHCLDELRKKLTRKDYEIAYGYYYTMQYPAAYESFKRFLNLYPEAQQREEAMFYMLESGYLYAANSREEKQYERYQLVVNDFEKFSSSFADSKYLEKARDYYSRSRAAMAAIQPEK